MKNNYVSENITDQNKTLNSQITVYNIYKNILKF